MTAQIVGRHLPDIRSRQDGLAFAATWLIDAPWAHPVWRQYVLSLVDLATPMETPALIVLTGATHEVMVYALDPDHPVDAARPASEQSVHRLRPPNHGYQLKATTDEAAQERIQSIVDAIDARRLSPDTDARPAWEALFGGGRSLRWSA